MAIDLDQQWFPQSHQLRYAATPKRLRALLDERTVLDTRDALLVYSLAASSRYTVPPGDLHMDLTEHDPSPLPQLKAPVLSPHHNEWHTVPGRSLHHDHGEVAFQPDSPSSRPRGAALGSI